MQILTDLKRRVTAQFKRSRTENLLQTNIIDADFKNEIVDNSYRFSKFTLCMHDEIKLYD